jgi:hypothetical protein
MTTTGSEGEAGSRSDGLQLERRAAGDHAPPAHVLGERRHRELLRDLRLAHEGARTAAADEVALPHEAVERGADGEP